MEKALLYTASEGDVFKTVDFELSVDDFLDQSNSYLQVDNYNWSSMMGMWMSGKCWLIQNIKVHSLFFSDGSVYDLKVGLCKKRVHPYDLNAEFVNKTYNDLKQKQDGTKN